jgi:hypothetical protein|tara:strand:- start:214 stop:1212 length:999 start_codon:yes stop_codon:yes gene_type:complete
MKKALLFLALFTFTLIGFNQYTFSTRTGTYSNLTGATSLTNGGTWDDPQLTIPIGFNFTLFDSTISTIFIEDYGLGADLTITDSESGIVPFLTPFISDIIDRGYNFTVGDTSTGGLSPISYKLTGTSGSRILKIEWKNVGFYSDIDDNGISIDYANFQLWLYEGSNNIEMHYGPSSVTQAILCYEGDLGTIVFLTPNYDFSTDDIGVGSYNIHGNPTSPTFSTISAFTGLNTMSSTIPNTRIYKFTKSTVASVNELNSKDFKLFPNPSNQFISISSDNESIINVNITDITGKQVESIFQDFKSIDLSGLNSGIYFAQIKTENGSTTKKFVKK